jgi:O-antigen/teichoic acid export membrane protein
LLVLLLTVPVYLRLIGTERFGALSLVWLLLGYFGLFDFGFGRAITKRIAELHDQPDEARSRVFWTGTLISLLAGSLGGLALWMIGEALFANVFQVSTELRQEAQAAMPWVALALPLVTGISALSGALQGREAFVTTNIAQSIGLVLYQVLPLAVATFGLISMTYLVTAAIAGRLVSAAIMFICCLRDVPASLRPQVLPSEIRPMLAYGGWLTVTAAISPILNAFDRFVIGTISGMAAVAIYSVPYNIVVRVAVLPSSWQNAIFPRYAMVAEGEARRLLGNSIRFQVWMMTPVCVAGILLSKLFLSLWVGESFAAAAAPVGQILFAALLCYSLAVIPYSHLQGRGRPDITAKIHLLELCLYAPILWVMIESFGVNGAAWAWAVRVTMDMAFLFVAARCSIFLKAAAAEFALVICALVWALLDPAGPTIYYGVAVSLLLGCALWTWISIPAEAVNILPPWVAARLRLRN